MPDLARVANARGLEYLPLFGNASMLRLLDLPAILEVRIPGTEGPRWVTLVGLGWAYQLVVADRGRRGVPRAPLVRPGISSGATSSRSARRSGATAGQIGRASRPRGVGAYHGVVNGLFDAPTEAAVLVPALAAPRRRRTVGSHAHVLYGAAGGYARPTSMPS
jgi:hypothetical protein